MEEKRILVVDDDDAIRALLLTILKRSGLTADFARNGAEALERLGHCSYSLMLLDLMMPVVSGWEVLEHVAKLDPSARPIIIVLTAGNEPRNLNADVVAGTVRKPFDVELLLNSVTACLAMLKSQRQIGECPPADSDRKDRSETE